jgi:hypothetical protein
MVWLMAVVVGWTEPADSRPQFCALLLGYYTDDRRLHYAGGWAPASRWKSWSVWPVYWCPWKRPASRREWATGIAIEKLPDDIPAFICNPARCPSWP